MVQKQLGDYTESELLALPAGEELDEIVHAVLGTNKLGSILAPTTAYTMVLLSRLIRLWPDVTISHDGLTVSNGDDEKRDGYKEVTSDHITRAVALALVVAAWHKAKEQGKNGK